MNELQYAYRVPPCSKYDIAGMESWLEDMAAKGLFLDRDGLFLGVATFVREEPAALRFRLEATGTVGGMFSEKNDPEDEVIELHRQTGWDYRGRWGQFHIYATGDPDALELHTDPRVQALTIQALNKFQRENLFEMFFYTLLMFLFHGSIVCSLTALWGVVRTVLAMGVLLSFPVMETVHLVQMIRLKRQLKAGIPMTHRADYRRHTALNYSARAVRWIVSVFLVCSLLSLWSDDVTGDNTVALEDWTAPLPFATVEELFPEGSQFQEEGFISDEVIYWSNWIAPENYDFDEYRWVTFPDGSETSGYIHIIYHKVRFPWFAQALAREEAMLYSGSLMDRLFGDGSVPEELEGVDADYAASYYKYNPGIILCSGDTVINVRYSREIGSYYTPEEFAQLILDHLR